MTGVYKHVKTTFAVFGRVSCFTFEVLLLSFTLEVLNQSTFVYICVSVHLQNIPLEVLNQSTSFIMEVFPFTQGGNLLILKKNRPPVAVGLGGPTLA